MSGASKSNGTRVLPNATAVLLVEDPYVAKAYSYPADSIWLGNNDLSSKRFQLGQV